jgi:hypothetical protein
VPQPHSVAIDLLLPNDEIMAQTEKHCRETPRKIGEDLLLTRFPTRSHQMVADDTEQSHLPDARRTFCQRV